MLRSGKRQISGLAWKRAGWSDLRGFYAHWLCSWQNLQISEHGNHTACFREYSTGKDIDPVERAENTHDFTEMKKLLSQPLSEQSREVRRRSANAELPVGGGSMPAVPTLDTPISRLLGRKGHAKLEELKKVTGSGQTGVAIAKALKDVSRPQVLTSVGLSARGEDLEELLEKWEGMLKLGEYDTVMREMQARPGDADDIITALKQHGFQTQKQLEKEARRQRENAIKAAFAAKRVRMVDEYGRAYATGKRKCSIARVWIMRPPSSRTGLGQIRVNSRRFDDYFKALLARLEVMKPFEVTDTLGEFDVKATVTGGGYSGQAQALRHGLSKALQNWDPELRLPLRAAGLLTRDSRIVERKKPGKAKARKSFQWVKR